MTFYIDASGFNTPPLNFIPIKTYRHSCFRSCHLPHTLLFYDRTQLPLFPNHLYSRLQVADVKRWLHEVAARQDAEHASRRAGNVLDIDFFYWTSGFFCPGRAGFDGRPSVGDRIAVHHGAIPRETSPRVECCRGVLFRFHALAGRRMFLFACTKLRHPRHHEICLHPAYHALRFCGCARCRGVSQILYWRTHCGMDFDPRFLHSRAELCCARRVLVWYGGCHQLYLALHPLIGSVLFHG